MQRLFTPLFFLLFLSFPAILQATHIVGGEMTYACLGNNQYEIKLTIFRDCFNGSPQAPFDNPASIGVFDDENTYLFQLLVPLDLALDDTLSPDLFSECFVIPPNVCVHTTTYTTVANLPFRPGGYQLVYQRCCRNQTIANILNPLTVGATYSIHLTEEALLACNSSPKFNNWPPLYLCVNKPFSIDQAATDSDGDSLVYRLCNPLEGANQQSPQPQPPFNPPYDTVPWITPPYGIDNMLNAVAGGQTMRIDLHTGLLTGTPNTLGQFVIGICIEEYRNGVLLSVSRRDYQVNVGDCGIITSSFFAPAIQCDNLTVVFSNQSQNATEYLWFFNDPANPNATSTQISPTYTYSGPGVYNIVLIAEPGVICADTFETTVTLVNNTIEADFDYQFTACSDSLTVQVTDSSVDSATFFTGWEWVMSYGQTQEVSNAQNPVFQVFSPGEATLTLTLTNANHCEASISKSFTSNLIRDALPDTINTCKGAFLNPDGFVEFATYDWQPPDGLDNPNSPNPFALPLENTTYSVSITDEDGFCQIERQVVLLLQSDAMVEVTPLSDTIARGGSVPLTATELAGFQYRWEPSGSLSNNQIFNPVASPNETTEYTLTLTDPEGCLLIRTLTIVVLPPCEDPYIFIPTGFTPNGDGVNETFKVIGNTLDEVYLVVYNRWGEKVFETDRLDEGWDGTFKGQDLPPDAYGYNAIVKCAGGTVFSKKGNVSLLR
jgi:gliding motility-associated-like protein